MIKTCHVTTIDLTAYCFLRYWMRCLQQNGAEVVLACSLGPFREELELCTDRLIDIPISRRIEPVQDLKAFVALYKLYREYKPDIVHSHTSKAGFLSRLAARCAGVPLILHTIHELPENAARNRVQKAVYYLLEWIAARAAHHHITVSYANHRQITGELICAPDDLTVISCGIDLNLYDPSSPVEPILVELKIPPGARVIGTAGRFEYAKGYPYLLQAFRSIYEKRPDCYLVCVGDGVLLPKIRSLAGELGIEDRVRFPGFVSKLPPVMNAFDVFVLASLYEGLGTVLLEAMALHKPVVSTAVGGTTDVVIDGKTGYLVPPRDPDKLAAKILELLDDPERRKMFGMQGRARVEQHYSVEVSNRKLLELYRKLWQRHGYKPWEGTE